MPGGKVLILLAWCAGGRGQRAVGSIPWALAMSSKQYARDYLCVNPCEKTLPKSANRNRKSVSQMSPTLIPNSS